MRGVAWSPLPVRQPNPRRLVVMVMAVLAMPAIVLSVQPARYRAHVDLAREAPSLHRFGLFPCMIEVFEYKVGDVVPREDWSREASEMFGKALVEELAADGVDLIVCDESEPEMGDLADLYSAVDVSITQDARREEGKQWSPKRRTGKQASPLEYSLGPADKAMERDRLDAVWFVAGYNLQRTGGKAFLEGMGTFLGVLGGGGIPHPLRSQIRASLVARSGEVLFHCSLDESNIPNVKPRSGGTNPGSGTYPAGDVDNLLDPRTAIWYARAVLSEYEKAARP